MIGDSSINANHHSHHKENDRSNHQLGCRPQDLHRTKDAEYESNHQRGWCPQDLHQTKDAEYESSPTRMTSAGLTPNKGCRVRIVTNGDDVRRTYTKQRMPSTNRTINEDVVRRTYTEQRMPSTNRHQRGWRSQVLHQTEDAKYESNHQRGCRPQVLHQTEDMIDRIIGD